VHPSAFGNAAAGHSLRAMGAFSMLRSSYNGDMRLCLKLLLLSCLTSTGLYADAPAFDLMGPKVDVHVKRGEVTLPIGEVPNLQPNDRLWIHPDLPESQSAHYVLIVAFLRGATNPPPPEWFTRVETWNRQVRDEGVFVTVPAEAQQALIFLAPETGGDFSTLRAAVRGRPGAFVRATQDLQAASLDRMRLDAYLAEVKVTTQTDPKLLKDRAEMAARSLGIKLDKECFDKPSDQQAPCLVQHTDGLVLDDANAQSMVVQLANGSTGDLMNQLSYAPMAGGGLYSPYVGAIVDTARILASLHTAHFQYIPALALTTKDTLNLRLNVPPSFRDPKSVVVVALPAIGPAKPPLMRLVNPEATYCAQQPGLVFSVEGAPVVFSTQLAFNLALHVETQANGKTSSVDLPVKADASAGGLVLENPPPTLGESDLTAVLRGKWGFDNWEGPHFHLHVAQPGKWTVAAGEQSALVVGREDTLRLEDDSAICVDRVDEHAEGGKQLPLTWKSAKPDALEVAVSMKDAAPGPVTLEVHQFGLETPDRISLTAYAEAASLDRLTLSAGDRTAMLRGNRLDEVATADLAGIALKPAKLKRVKDFDQLAMSTEASTASLEPGKAYNAIVELQDGRKLKVPVTVGPPRPQVTLLNKGVQDDASSSPSPVRLASADDLPVDGRLVFFLKSRVPADFPRDEKVEVAAVDGSFATVLSLADASLMLEDAKTAMGSLEPLGRFGQSAFGPVQVRAMSADGVTGDWLPLGTLVRLPGFRELRCPHGISKPCTLTGTNLFLASSIAAAPDFNNSTDVPPDFTGTQLSVPHSANGLLYLRLRDDPATVQTVTLPVTPALPGSQPPIAPASPGTQEPGKAEPASVATPDATANR
jgi:hypothetical protein